MDQIQALADEKDRELTQTWQQLRELQSEFRQLQLDSETQIKAAKEAQEVSLDPAYQDLLPNVRPLVQPVNNAIH